MLSRLQQMNFVSYQGRIVNICSRSCCLVVAAPEFWQCRYSSLIEYGVATVSSIHINRPLYESRSNPLQLLTFYSPTRCILIL